MKVTEQHLRQVDDLDNLMKYLNFHQKIVLEALLDCVYNEGRSQGYREGNPGWDED